MGLTARRRHRGGHFADVVVRLAVNVVVQIVKLADRGEPSFQHLHVGESRNRPHVGGRQAIEKTIHRLAPCPETVRLRPAALGEPRHAALESVAMQVGKTWNGDAGDAFGSLGGRAFRNGEHGAVLYADAHVLGPAGRKPRVIEEQFTVQAAISAFARTGYGPIFGDK